MYGGSAGSTQSENNATFPTAQFVSVSCLPPCFAHALAGLLIDLGIVITTHSTDTRADNPGTRVINSVAHKQPHNNEAYHYGAAAGG